MNEVVWYRSLYWRTALGAFACLTGLLLAQAALFLWLAGRTDRPVLSQSPPRVLRLVSLDLTTALESDPSLDIAAYMRDQLMLEILLDIRDLFSVAPAASGGSALEKLEAIRRLTKLP